MLNRIARLSTTGAWFVLLFLPAVIEIATLDERDINTYYRFSLSIVSLLLLRILMPGRLIFPITFPLLLIGMASLFAVLSRHIDLLTLLVQLHVFSKVEVHEALQPYFFMTAVVVATTTVWCWICYRISSQQRTHRTHILFFMLCSVLIGLTTPSAILLQTWPIDALIVVPSVLIHSKAVSNLLLPTAADVNPRNPNATWNTVRVPRDTPIPQTIVLIIGESIRNDFLRECGGPQKVRSVAEDALVACDVTAGADATGTSVPLLVSREMPGHAQRISSDATFIHALEELGFETYWFSTQTQTVAWSDAQHQTYYEVEDDALLFSAFDRVLSTPPKHKVIVLHAYNAHAPYCLRYHPETAPYQVACDGLIGIPTRRTLADFKVAYANAVDASIGFVNQIIRRASQSPGEVFLVFTPDHAEALLEDTRQIYGHALARPVQWDIHVPAIFWANNLWRQEHEQQWTSLHNKIHDPLMHMDIVPTLMAAAEVTYTEPRTRAMNLLNPEKNIISRMRTIQHTLGTTVDWETLLAESQHSRPRNDQ